MSSFLFLHFCDDALWLLGLYFSAFHLFKTFLWWLFTAAAQAFTEALHASNRAGLGSHWCRSTTRPLTGQKLPHRAEFGFSPQNEFTPPPKGGGAGYRLSLGCWVFHAEKPGAFPQEKTDTSYPRASLGSCLWQLLVTTGSHRPNRAGLGLWRCRFPTWLSKSHTRPHRGEFGSHRFFLLCFGFGRVDKALSSL